ncbi:MAG: hypothetical protein HYT85_19085 [candidate division NC10 bacterium]|nr:hypothetical protein [candidate division NC10 bacterium]
MQDTKQIRLRAGALLTPDLDGRQGHPIGLQEHMGEAPLFGRDDEDPHLLSEQCPQPIGDAGVELLGCEPAWKIPLDPGIPRGIEARRQVHRIEAVGLDDPRPPRRLKLAEERGLRHPLEDSAQEDGGFPADLQGGPHSVEGGRRFRRRLIPVGAPDLAVRLPGGRQGLVGGVADDAVEVQGQDLRGSPRSVRWFERSRVRLFMNSRTPELPNVRTLFFHRVPARNIVSSILKRPAAWTA